MNLDNRLSKLEAKMEAVEDQMVIIVDFVNADRSRDPVAAYRNGDQIINRNPGESDNDFTERAKNEALASRPPGSLNGTALIPVEPERSVQP
jgi:hypothetical protein